MRHQLPSGAQLFFVLSCSGMKWMYTCDNMLLFSIRNGRHNTRDFSFTSSLHLNVCNCQACQRFPFLYSSSYKKRQTTLRPTTHVPNCITTSNSRPFNIYLAPLSLISRWHWWDKFFICCLISSFFITVLKRAMLCKHSQ